MLGIIILYKKFEFLEVPISSAFFAETYPVDCASVCRFCCECLSIGQIAKANFTKMANLLK